MVALVPVFLVLTGCSPAIRGLVGITVSDAGTPVALLAPCEGTVAGIKLYEIDPESSNRGDIKRWDFEAGSAPAEFDFLGSVPQIDPVARFELVAWAWHPSWPNPVLKNLDGVWFDFADLDRLDPGQVLYRDPDSFKDSITSDRAEFETTACPPE